MRQPQHPRIRAVTVKNLLSEKPPESYSISINATLHEALKTMSQHNIDGVAVLDGEHLAGTFSERDLARMASSDSAFMADKPLSHAMTPALDFVTPDQIAQSCLALMLEKRLNLIPVMEHGKLIGLLSIVELQQAIITQYESIFQAYALDQKILFLQGTYSC
ncbi:MAG: CBS domain-containing protein [Betaproteobacteria bacterium]